MSETAKSQKRTGKRYTKWLIGLAILLMGIAALAAWRFSTRVPLLQNVAARVVPYGWPYGPEDGWISNEECVNFGRDGRTLSLYHLSRGTATPLLGQFDAQSSGGKVSVSPNGKWLCWSKITDLGRHGGTTQFYITHLEDARTYDTSSFIPDYWEPDSKHIIGSGFAGSSGWNTVIFDVSGNRVSQTLPDDSRNTPATDARMVAPGRLLEVSKMRQMEIESEENELVEVREYGVDKSVHLIRKGSIAPPHDTTVNEIMLSPTGDRIAWLVDADHVDPALVALHRFLPFLKTPSHPQQELWISRLDGTGMRVIGQSPMSARNGHWVFTSELRWLPDGKHLSFLYDNALWTVPIQR